MKIRKKIVLAGTFNIGALEHQFYRGLTNNETEVIKFDISSFNNKINMNFANKILYRISENLFYKEINEKLISFVAKIKPDVLFVVKGTALYPETLEACKLLVKLLISFNPDHPFEFYSRGSGNLNIKKSLSVYNLHLSYSKNICKRIIEELNKPAYWIPFGYDESILVNSVNKNDFKNRIIFVGAYDKERSKFFKDLNDDKNISIFGEDKWGSRNKGSSLINNIYKKRSLYNEEYYSAIYNAFGCINILRKQNIVEQSHNMRTFEVAGYGGLLIAHRTEEQLFFFEENKEAIYFNSIEELREKIKYLLENPEKALKIKEASRKRIQQSAYSYTDRCKEILEIINKHIN